MALAYSLRFFRSRITMNGNRETERSPIDLLDAIDVALTEMFIFVRSKRISDDAVRLRPNPFDRIALSASIADLRRQARVQAIDKCARFGWETRYH